LYTEALGQGFSRYHALLGACSPSAFLLKPHQNFMQSPSRITGRSSGRACPDLTSMTLHISGPLATPHLSNRSNMINGTEPCTPPRRFASAKWIARQKLLLSEYAFLYESRYFALLVVPLRPCRNYRAPNSLFSCTE
jgi:hypothetical protein